MPEKWQRWMPLEIDALRASPAVQAMHPAARAGYIWLLLDAWQTDDCTIPNDALDLAEKSGLGDELWNLHGPRILRKFDPVEGSNRLRNQVCFEKWLEAKRIFEARRESAQRTTKVRSPRKKATVTVLPGHGHRTVTDGIASRRAHTRTETYTETNTSTETNTKANTKATTLAPSDTPHPSEPVPVSPKLKGTLPLVDKTDFEITDVMIAEWQVLYPAVDVAQECRNMKGWCLANPDRRKTRKGILRFITGWLEKEQDRAGPTHAKPNGYVNGHSNGNGGFSNGTGTNQPSAAKQRLDNNRRALAEAAVRRGWLDPDGAAREGAETVAEPGHGRVDGGVSGGLRTPEPEILPPARRGGSG